MFTDIVGATERAGELGDRAWKKLLERHNAIVRRELKRFAGRELDTAGDGFFVMFERPAQAIDCAWAVMDALRPLGLQIRAAVHMGEVEVMGGKVGGIAVHAASRVLGLAQPGQIYVTGIVRDVVAGSDISFSERGVHELRGVPGEWRLYAVEEAATDRALPIEPLPEPIAGRRNWPAAIAALAVVAVVAVVGTALVLGSLSRPAPIVPRPNSVVQVSAADGSLSSIVGIEDPTDIAIDADALWVLSATGRTVSRVDKQTLVVSAVGLPGAPTGVALSDGALWITTGFGAASGEVGIVRVGTTSKTREGGLDLGAGAEGVAAGEGAVWVTNRLDNTVTRIDLTTGTVSGTAEVGEQPASIVVGEGAVWVANTIERTVWRLDPRSLAGTAEIALAASPYDLAIGFGRVWVTSEQGNSVTVIEVATNTIQRTLTMPGPARGIAVGPDDVWVATGNGELVRIDPDTADDLMTVSLGGNPHDVAVDAAGAWVSIRE